MPPVKTLPPREPDANATPDWDGIEYAVGREEMAFALLDDASIEDARRSARERMKTIRAHYRKTGELPDGWTEFVI